MNLWAPPTARPATADRSFCTEPIVPRFETAAESRDRPSNPDDWGTGAFDAAVDGVEAADALDAVDDRFELDVVDSEAGIPMATARIRTAAAAPMRTWRPRLLRIGTGLSPRRSSARRSTAAIEAARTSGATGGTGVRMTVRANSRSAIVARQGAQPARCAATDGPSPGSPSR
jgi:hypothetical protein